ncbi:MAG: hypothetical protein WC124_10700 [Desulfoplanes sp.]
MMNLDEIKSALVDRRPGKVAAETGLHYNTIKDVRDNPNTNPTWSTMQALSDYLEGKGRV